ncbi:MAG TPA: HEAT repeat domain-containing protein, partial [bacterium]|nr:HEAT repeat domain-containing protein [bacterium]
MNRPVVARAARAAGLSLLAAFAVLAALAAQGAPSSAQAAAETLQEALRHLQADDVLLADAAVEEIVAFGPPGADALLPLLDDPRRDVRAGAIRGLGLLREPRAAASLRDLLTRSLNDTSPDTMDDRYFRILAVQALGRIGDGDSAELLRRVLADGDEFERAHAGISLFLFGEDPGYDVVRECLADTAVAIRNLAVEGLGDSGNDQARELVLSMTDDESWVVRDSAYRVLAGWPRDGAVREALRKG